MYGKDARDSVEGANAPITTTGGCSTISVSFVSCLTLYSRYLCTPYAAAAASPTPTNTPKNPAHATRFQSTVASLALRSFSSLYYAHMQMHHVSKHVTVE